MATLRRYPPAEPPSSSDRSTAAKAGSTFSWAPGPAARSVDLGDLGRGRDDVAVGVGRQEEAVGDPGRAGGLADEDVDPIAVPPERADLHLEQVFGRAEGADHVL